MGLVTVEVKDSASEALGKIAPDVRAALKTALNPISKQLTQDVRAAALAHIHSFGAKPGLYLASIYGGVSDKPGSVSAYVRTGNQLAHLLEYGTKLHTIQIVKKRVLASAERTFGQIVNVSAPAYPAFAPVVAAREAQMSAILTETVARAAADAKA